jgi:hypothetical protein
LISDFGISISDLEYFKPSHFGEAFFVVRPAGRFYLVMKVHYGPVKGNH